MKPAETVEPDHIAVPQEGPARDYAWCLRCGRRITRNPLTGEWSH